MKEPKERESLSTKPAGLVKEKDLSAIIPPKKVRRSPRPPPHVQDGLAHMPRAPWRKVKGGRWEWWENVDRRWACPALDAARPFFTSRCACLAGDWYEREANRHHFTGHQSPLRLQAPRLQPRLGLPQLLTGRLPARHRPRKRHRLVRSLHSAQRPRPGPSLLL